MFKKILFPIDLSAASLKVFECVPDLRSVGLKEAIIGHVLDVRLAGGAAPSLRKSDREILEKKRAELEKQGLNARVEVVIGFPFVEIVELAKREDVSMIIMTEKGESFVQQALLGSVAENVVRHARRSVLVQKFAPVREKGEEECELVCRNLFRRILYPTDFSDSAEKVINYLKEMGNAGCEEIIVYHVQDTRVISHRLIDRIQEFNEIDSIRLGKIKTRLKQLGFRNVTTRLETGVSISEILESAEELDVCLIVMGSHGRSKVAEMFLGSVSENVVRRSTRPVLLVHAG